VVVLSLCIVDGVFRKWVFHSSSPGVQAIFYFAKDFVFLIAGVVAIRHSARSRETFVSRVALLIGAFVIIMAVPLSTTEVYPIGAMLSLRSMLVLPCLALLTAPSLRSMRDIELIILVGGCYAVGNAVLGAIQFYLPESHFLNRQVETQIRAAVAVGRVRVSGTFSYLMGIANMAIMGSWAGCYLILVHPRRPWGYIFVLAALTCGAAALSRIGLFFSLFIITFTLFSASRGIIPGVLLACILAGLTFFSHSDDEGYNSQVGLIEGTFARHQFGDSIADRAAHTTGGLPTVLEDTPLGHGLGAGQGGEAAASGAGNRQYQAGAEQELPRIAWEIGIIGLLGILIFRTTLLTVLGLAWFRNRGSSPAMYHLRRVSLLTILMYFAYNTVFDHVASTFTWIITTVALASFEIEAREKRQALAAAAMAAAFVRPAATASRLG
jgi:hypothetical protein